MKTKNVSKKTSRASHVTEKEEAAYQESKSRIKQGKKLEIVSLFELNPATTKKIEGMAFRQVQTTSQLAKTNERLELLTSTVSQLAAAVESQLSRLRVPTVDSQDSVFVTKCFNKISIKLRKRTVDVTVEDIHQGAKRRRLFRCDSFSKVEHLLSTRTVIEGIEEITLVRRPKAASGKKTRAKTSTNRKPAKTIEEVRYEMERDGLPNAVIPQTRNKYYDANKATVNASANRTREKAEKVIVKLCSPGAQLEGVLDERLVDALVESGFAPQVAFAAASNCGRITKKGLESRYNPAKNSKETTSNEY